MATRPIAILILIYAWARGATKAECWRHHGGIDILCTTRGCALFMSRSAVSEPPGTQASSTALGSHSSAGCTSLSQSHSGFIGQTPLGHLPSAFVFVLLLYMIVGEGGKDGWRSFRIRSSGTRSQTKRRFSDTMCSTTLSLKLNKCSLVSNVTIRVNVASALVSGQST